MPTAVRRLLAPAVGLPATFWWLWGGMLLNRAGSFVVPFLSMYLVDQRGLTISRAGLVVSSMGLGAVFGSLTGGLLADRWGRRSTLLLSTFGSAAAMVTIGFTRSVPAIAALVLVLGFVGDLFRPALQAAIADVVAPERRVAAFGLVFWAVNLGWAVAMPIAGLLSSWSWLALFVADGATTALFGLFVLLQVPETRPAEARESEAHPLAGLRRALADRDLRAFLALQLLFILVLFQVFATLPLAMAAGGLSRATYGALASLNGLVIIAVQPLAMRGAARRDPARVMALAALVLGAGFGLFALAGPGGRLVYAVGIVVWTLGEIANITVAPALVAALAPAAHRGAYQGTWTMVWAVAHLGAPALGTQVLERGGPRVLWGGCLAIGVAVALGQLGLGPRLRARLGPAGLAGEPGA